MTWSSLVSVPELRAAREPEWALFDCRFDLSDPEAGRRAYAAGHLPGAVYLHLEADLSDPPAPGRGRHPLPGPEALAERFGAWGIGPGVQVVAYDASGGAMAARLWWMLRYLGHESAAVLDGGWPAWLAAGGEVETAPRAPVPARFVGAPRRDRLVTLDEVPGAARLVDARDPARYRGETEPLDPVAGHIPGAVNLPFAGNLGADGRFLPAGALRARVEAALGTVRPEDAVYYCGSGVTACHDLLAAARAGLPMGRLYAGSWSEWCSDPSRPVATGEEEP